ncbi:hypothetical protein SAMN05216548_102389 [Faunimonas pinastri]|uniref:Uncharacterized protein n=1 Tax=Faunimonas pinastri TaxID=1855383 RepID=A0A1H9D9D4_9HYPH|nr:hypothetical protein [Faunimonas pinastri]SEQ09937.1 hypothetical protein SAMN05216548_102389 [Faunimonas pinastri]
MKTFTAFLISATVLGGSSFSVQAGAAEAGSAARLAAPIVKVQAVEPFDDLGRPDHGPADANVGAPSPIAGPPPNDPRANQVPDYSGGEVAGVPGAVEAPTSRAAPSVRTAPSVKMAPSAKCRTVHVKKHTASGTVTQSVKRCD